MDSIGAAALNNPILDNYYIAEDSPVLSQKPIFFANDPLDAIKNESEELNPEYWDCKIPDEFKQKVRQRKQQGFIGTEYTAEEAMSKQFGPEQIEARAFLEYYWEMKAKCLEAVEKKRMSIRSFDELAARVSDALKGHTNLVRDPILPEEMIAVTLRNSEVEAFQKHPLFSPDWLIPSKRDIRWYLKHEIRNEKKEVGQEKNRNGSESQTLRKEATAENTSSVHKGIPDTRKVGSLQLKPVGGKRGVPLKENRKPVVRSNPSAVSLKRFVGTRNLETRDSQPKPVERKNGYKMKLAEIRKPVSKSHQVSHIKESQCKRPEGKNGSEIHLREPGKLVVRKNPSVSYKRLLATEDIGYPPYRLNECRKGSKIPVREF